MKWNIGEVEDAFVRWLCDLGVPPAEGERLILDGEKRRYRVAGDHRDNTEYRVYMDEWPAGSVVDHKHRLPEGKYMSWQFYRKGSKTPQWSDEEREEYLKRKEAEREARERQKELARAAAITKARKMWKLDYSQYSGHELRGKIYLPHRLLNKTDRRIETLSRQVKACH